MSYTGEPGRMLVRMGAPMSDLAGRSSLPTAYWLLSTRGTNQWDPHVLRFIRSGPSRRRPCHLSRRSSSTSKYSRSLCAVAWQWIDAGSSGGRCREI